MYYIALISVCPVSPLLQALLNCEVTAVEDNLVSWFLVTPHSSLTDPAPSGHALSTHAPYRHTPALSLLTVGFQTYSSDMRYVSK